MKTLSLSVLVILTAAPAALAADPPSYSKQVRPFLTRYCPECHNAKEPQGGLNLESYASLMEGGQHGPVLVAGKADDSRIVGQVEGKMKPTMPPKKASRRPTPEEAAVLRAWIDAGAKDDGGSTVIVLPDIKPRTHVAAPVAALAYRPDGKLLAAAGWREVLLIDPTTGDVVGKLPGQAGDVTALAFSRDGSAAGRRRRFARRRRRGAHLQGRRRRRPRRPAGPDHRRPQGRHSRSHIQSRRQDAGDVRLRPAHQALGRGNRPAHPRTQGPQRRGLRRRLQPGRRRCSPAVRPTGR